MDYLDPRGPWPKQTSNSPYLPPPHPKIRQIIVMNSRSEEGLEAWDDKFGRGWSRFIAALALLRSWNKLRHFSSYLVVVGNSIFMATE